LYGSTSRSVWFLLSLCGISSGIPHSPFPYFPHTYQAPYTPNLGHFQPAPFSRSGILPPQYGYLYPSGLSRSGVPSPQYGHLHPIDSYRSSMPSHLAFANTVENVQHTTNQASSAHARYLTNNVDFFIKIYTFNISGQIFLLLV